MTTGLMFFFGDKDLQAEIQKAAKRYFDRFGKPAEICLVHPSELQAVEIPGITVRPWGYVIKGNLHIGVEYMPTVESETA